MEKEKRIELTEKTLKDLPDNLKAIRIGRDTAQGEVADKMGVLQSHTSMLENKKYKKVPTLPTLIRYLKAVGCKIIIVVPGKTA